MNTWTDGSDGGGKLKRGNLRTQHQGWVEFTFALTVSGEAEISQTAFTICIWTVGSRVRVGLEEVGPLHVMKC
jgi:hypothetical protein